MMIWKEIKKVIGVTAAVMTVHFPPSPLMANPVEKIIGKAVLKEGGTLVVEPASPRAIRATAQATKDLLEIGRENTVGDGARDKIVALLANASLDDKTLNLVKKILDQTANSELKKAEKEALVNGVELIEEKAIAKQRIINSGIPDLYDAKKNLSVAETKLQHAKEALSGNASEENRVAYEKALKAMTKARQELDIALAARTSADIWGPWVFFGGIALFILLGLRRGHSDELISCPSESNDYNTTINAVLANGRMVSYTYKPKKDGAFYVDATTTEIVGNGEPKTLKARTLFNNPDWKINKISYGQREPVNINDLFDQDSIALLKQASDPVKCQEIKDNVEALQKALMKKDPNMPGSITHSNPSKPAVPGEVAQ